MPIIEMTRGHIDFAYGGKVVRIGGELLVPEGNCQHYLVYESSITGWLPPDSGTPLTSEDRTNILLSLKQELSEDKVTVEIDTSSAAAGTFACGAG